MCLSIVAWKEVGCVTAVKGPMELSGEVALLSILIILMVYVNG